MALPFYTPGIPEMTVSELNDLIRSDNCPVIIDVRQPEEREIACIGGVPIPLHELPHRLDEIACHQDQSIVVYCRSGTRSSQAVSFMRAMGYDGAVNLKGGINAWSQDIDPSIPLY